MSTPYYAAGDQKITIKSPWIGLILTIFQLAYLGTTILIVLLSVVNVVSPSTYADFEIAYGILVLLGLVLFLALIVTFLIWAYVLHGDLKTLFGRYSITPGSALAQLMIPFYNLWGIWNVFSTLGNQFKWSGGELEGFGSDIRFWLPFLYVMSILARIMDRIVMVQSSHSDDVASPKLVLVSAGLDMMVALIWLVMTRTIVKGVNRVAELRQSEASNNAVNPALG
jgi:hypothetical protein